MGSLEPTNQLTVRENIEMLFPDDNPMLFMDGFDDAIIGYCDKEMKVIYSATKIIDELMSQGMTDEEAIEHFEYNIDCAYVGKHTPIICKDGVLYLS